MAVPIRNPFSVQRTPDSSGGGGPTGPADPSALDPGWIRNLVGILVLLFGMGGILWIAGRGLGIPSIGAGEFDKIFSTLVAVSGGWVSTVLVFYFSRESYQAAQSAVNQAVNAAVNAGAGGSGSGSGAQVKSVMTVLDKLIPLKLAGRPETAVPLQELCVIFSQNPTITRTPVLKDDGSAVYVIHDATFYRFMSDQVVRGQPVVLTATAGAPVATLADLLDHTLKDGQNHDLTFRQVVSGFVTLTPTLSLDDAQTALLTANAQDAVVTADGKPTSPMVGLLTSDAFARRASV